MLAFVVPLLALQFSLGQSIDRKDADTQQAARKKAWEEYSAHLQVFRESAKKAFADEQIRAKAGDCPKEQTTFDISICLKGAVEKTTANYRAYSNGLRSMEGLADPDEMSSAGSSKYSTSEELVKQFDNAETAWQVYKQAQCSAAYGVGKGGTIAPIMQLTCELTLFRDHMRELDSTYGTSEGSE